MVAQTTYKKPLAIGLPGLIYDMGFSNIDSFAAEEAVPFGAFVARGSDPANEVEVGGAAAIGIAVRTAKDAEFPPVAPDFGVYAIGDTVGVMREGYIYAAFDTVGGTVGAAVTINAEGQVVAAGGGTALTAVKAVIESVAVDVSIETSGIFAGLVHVYPV